ncbi:MAG: Fic family protein [Mycoplasmatales bacterium]
MDGGVLNGVAVDDINIVINLKNAWKEILKQEEEKINYEYILKIHSEVAKGQVLEWGKLRSGEVGISEIDYIPSSPEKTKVKEKILEILKIQDSLEKALKYYCYGTKNQLFWDGNKRTSLLISNKMLIDNGLGIMSKSKKNLNEYYSSLNEVYKMELKEFLKNKCIVNSEIRSDNEMNFELEMRGLS